MQKIIEFIKFSLNIKWQFYRENDCYSLPEMCFFFLQQSKNQADFGGCTKYLCHTA